MRERGRGTTANREQAPFTSTCGPSARTLRQPRGSGALGDLATPVQELLPAWHEGWADDARAIVRANPGIVERLQGGDARALTDEAWLAPAPPVGGALELRCHP